MSKKKCAVLVFSKAPVPGTVKTRLIPALNEVDAALLYQQLIERTLNTVIRTGTSKTQLWCTPITEHPYFLYCEDKFNIELRLQSGKDLGERMYYALSATLLDYHSVLLVGCDCPELRHEDLYTAMEMLADGYDAVLGPSADGGYYLIGVSTVNKKIFDGIQWGQDTVLNDTRNRLKELKFNFHELPERWDLDDAEDLKRYQNLISSTCS